MTITLLIGWEKTFLRLGDQLLNDRRQSLASLRSSGAGGKLEIWLRSWKANNKEIGRTTDTRINRVKVESWFQFVGHLESHYIAKEGRWQGESRGQIDLTAVLRNYCSQAGLKSASKKIENQARWKRLARRFGSWHAWLREWLIKLYTLLKSCLENVYSRIKKKWILVKTGLWFSFVSIFYIDWWEKKRKSI